MPVACESSNTARLEWADVDLYRFFAFVLSSPSAERFDTMAQPYLQDALAKL